MSRVRAGPSGWTEVEETICDDLPVPLRHEPDGPDSWDWYDATLMGGVEGTLSLPLRGRRRFPAGTRVELKTCQEWISNGSKRRRGRWTIHSTNHEQRVKMQAAYLLVVRDTEQAVLASAAYVDRLLDGAWTTGDNDHPGTQAAHLRWATVLPNGSDPHE